MGEIYFKKEIVDKDIEDLTALKAKLVAKTCALEFNEAKGEMVNEILQTGDDLKDVSQELTGLVDKTQTILSLMENKFTGTDSEIAGWFHNMENK